LATLATALDRRPRSGEEVADELGLPLLAKLPEPPRRVTKKMRLLMLERPNGSHAEALRLLRANLEFAIGENGVQVIMFVSAVGTEGKSATAANLGVALARIGERVVVVDLDLRQPRLARYFKLEASPGISDVVFGRTTVATAIAHLPLSGGTNGNQSHAVVAGRNGNGIDVLPAGTPPPNPGELVGSPQLRTLFAELREQYDVILVDTPPALAVGDAMTVSSVADALVVVSRPASLSRPQVRALHRILSACPTRKLGVVSTGATTDFHA
jgi:capsular exopolysaccharide synthesis family protein